nr:cation:proton antiporter [Salsipaludibacter albus]
MIVVLAVAGQLLALLLRVPSILVLLLLGMAAGGWLGWLEPDALFGARLFDAVDLAVAVILFEGGLLLNFRELRGDVSSVVRRLLSWGVVFTAVGGAAAGHWVLGMSVPVSLVFGAILTVSGPTVVLPLLRHVGVQGQVDSILKWEGVFIDAIGATLAVIVYETVLAGRGQWGLTTLYEAGLTLLVGLLVGLAAAGLMVVVMRWDAVDEHLATLLALATVMAAFVGADMLRHEAGLMSAIVMGVAMANQPWVSITRVARFKETLGLLLTSLLFIVLAARLELDELAGLVGLVAVVVAVLVLLLRPLVVAACSLGSNLDVRERLFVGWMAPRGIVAAATASVMGTGLEELGLGGAEDLVPAVFLVILGTVAVYGLTGRPVARLLGLAGDGRPHPTEVADQAGGRAPDGDSDADADTATSRSPT